jgi:hypothetical protein
MNQSTILNKNYNFMKGFYKYTLRVKIYIFIQLID